MRFNITIDSEDFDEYNSFDSEFKEKIERGIQEHILTDFNKEAGKQIAIKAERLITAKTELLINTLLERPITISQGWNKEDKYDSIYDMVEEQMTSLYDDKFDKAKGSCTKDPLLSNIENYVQQAMEELLRKVERKIKAYADIAARDALETSDLLRSINAVLDTSDS